MKVLCLFILLAVTSFYTSDLYSLEVDEKLTLKIIQFNIQLFNIHHFNNENHVEEV